MQDIYVTWGELKNIFQEVPQVLRMLVYIPTSKTYRLFLNYKGILFRCEINKNTAEGQDFEQNFKPKIQPGVDERGLPIVTPTIWDLPGNSRWRGAEGSNLLRFTTVPGVENFFDIQVTDGGYKYLKGGGYCILDVASVHDDDYIEFSIIDKDADADGLSDILKIPVPNPGDFAELVKFVEKWPVKGWEKYEFISQSAELLIGGLFIRIGYMSYGTAPVRFNGVLFWIDDLVEAV